MAFCYAWGALSLPVLALDRRLAGRGRTPALGLAWHVPGSLVAAALSAYLVPLFSGVLALPEPRFVLSLEPLRHAGRWGLASQLESEGQQVVSLAQELELLDHYLAIQAARFEDRLRLERCVPADTLEARVPSQLLQPLVENALRHGLAPRAAGGRVRIEAAHVGDSLRLCVIDDGVGLPREPGRPDAHRPATPGAGAAWDSSAAPGGSGRGLSITRERLARLYPGGRARLDLRAGADCGVVAEVVIPWQTGSQHQNEECDAGAL